MRVQWFAYLIFTVLLTSCKARYEESLVQLKIADNWEFKNASEPRWHKADVPGDIISEASKIKGFGERSFLNLRQLNEILNTSWEYRNIFNVSKDLLSKDSINISFPDIRGSARIYMNDSLLSGHMMNEGGSLSCKQYLKAGKNELRVVFGSVGVSYLSGKTDRAKDERISSLMKDLDHLPFRNIPAVPGLIETPFLTGWSDAKIEDVYFYPLAISGKMAQYNAEINIIASKELEVNLEICVDAKSVIKLNELKLKQGLNKQIVSFTIANPKLWWANGFGQQHLYNVTFRLISSSHLAHEVGYPLGACKFEVLYDPDSIGKSLIFMLNGNPVFLKGGTLDIPRNLNPSEVQALYQQIVDNAKAANINTIRLLNFNFTCDDLFYKLCSENGILVWQDFTVFKDKGKHNMDRFNYSIEQSVKYLRNLPCCAVYMGKNEDYCKDYKSKQIVRTTGVVEKKTPHND